MTAVVRVGEMVVTARVAEMEVAEGGGSKEVAARMAGARVVEARVAVLAGALVAAARAEEEWGEAMVAEVKAEAAKQRPW